MPVRMRLWPPPPAGERSMALTLPTPGSLVDNYFGKPSTALPVQPTGLTPRAEYTSPDRLPGSLFRPSTASDSPPRASPAFPASPMEVRGTPATTTTGATRGGIRAAAKTAAETAAAPENERNYIMPHLLEPSRYHFVSFLHSFYCFSQFTCVLSFLCAMISCQ